MHCNLRALFILSVLMDFNRYACDLYIQMLCHWRRLSLAQHVICRTKIQLASEIDDYAKKLVEDYEDLDKMSIQADIWHSKFKASRYVLVCNKLVMWKSHASKLNVECINFVEVNILCIGFSCC